MSNPTKTPRTDAVLRALSEHIDRVAAYDLSEKKVFGSAYLVYHGGQVLQKCYGTVALDTDAPVTDTTVFRLASMTKPVTAVATMILVERGLLSPEDPVWKYFPEFKDIPVTDAKGCSHPPKKHPTIKNILTHSSGIGSDPEKLSRLTEDDLASIDSLLRFLLHSGLDFEPDSMQMYSGIGAFDVLTRIIETVTSMDYLQFLEAEIFSPCGMTDTTFLPSKEQSARMIAMHTRVNGENAVAATPEGCVFENVPSTHFLGGAGLVSTLRDYAAFAKMLLRYGQTDKGRILREESVRLLSSPLFYKRKTEAWGLGVRVITDSSYHHLPVGAFGWSGAYGSHFWVDPSTDTFAVFMKNSKVDGGAGNESARKFEEAVSLALRDGQAVAD